MQTEAQASTEIGKPDVKQAATSAYQFLAFTRGQEEYGIDIREVQEIRGYESVTRIANAPEFIKGVINLRGTVVPIQDMPSSSCLGT